MRFLPAPALSAVEGVKGVYSLASNDFIGAGIYRDHAVTMLRPFIWLDCDTSEEGRHRKLILISQRATDVNFV